MADPPLKSPRLTIPPEPPLPYRLWFGGLEHHATALGYVCFTYANLEATINDLVEALLSCGQDARRAVVDATGNSIETRCNLILKLASIDPPSCQWFDDLEALLTRVRSELAPERNRLIHDVWMPHIDAGKVTLRQWDQRAFLKAAQSREPKKIAPPAEPERSLESVWDLVRRIQEIDYWIGMFSRTYARWKAGMRFGEFPSLPPEVRTRTDP